MSKPAYFFEPLGRSYRNWLRKRTRVLPTDLPPPFFCANDIGAVREYFSGLKDERAERHLKYSSGLHGECYLCKQEVDFAVEVSTGGEAINWRETLTCPKCSLINRWRSCLHVFEEICEPRADDRIYLTETLSPVCRNLADRFSGLSSSEYLPDATFGEIILRHEVVIRNEDVTNLSFDDASKEIILCFDVLEHVHDYRAALREFHRVLTAGGQLVISVPFSFRHETLVRATLDENGSVTHLTEPCYHGDPLSDKGVLSFYDFGMDLLEEMREAGFNECFVVCFYSEKWAYLNRNVVFIARKLKSSVSKLALVRSAWQQSVNQAGLMAESAVAYSRYAGQATQRFTGRLYRFLRRGLTREKQVKKVPVTKTRVETELPEIFHYWSNRYIGPDMARFGFASPEEFVFQQAMESLKQSTHHRVNMLSIGSGDCSFELRLARKLLKFRLDNFVIECLEVNPDKLNHGKTSVEKAGLAEYFQFTRSDLSYWKNYKKYSMVLAYYSLHDVRNLEGLFNTVKKSLKPNGRFIIADLVGRNGQMRWPEALDALKPFWDELPGAYRFNRVTGTREEQFINHDRAAGEGIGLRSQDILPLLLERFNFKFFYPYGNIIFAFVDRCFGPNFNAGAEWDRNFIDRVHASDEAGILSGELKPTSMLAVVTTQETEMVLRHPLLTPGYCVRKNVS